MKRLLFTITTLGLLAASAHALQWGDATGGVSSSGGGGGAGTITGVTAGSGLAGGGVSGTVSLNVSGVTPAMVAGTPPTNGDVMVATAPTAPGQPATSFVPATLVTDYTEPIIVTPEWGKSTTNTFDSSASTNPTFGKIKFDAAASKTTNCAYAVLDNFRNFTATTSANIVAVRIDQFRVMSGSATDTSGQTYIVAVASVADNVAVSSLVFTSSQTITVSAGSGTFKQRWQNATITASGWGPVFDVGAPVAFEICRDGTDASAIDSYGGIMTLRLATTSP